MNFRKIVLILFGLVISINLLSAQAKYTINGRIIDKETGDLLRGATIQLIGTNKGALTDMKGSFRIKDLSPNTYTLKISYIGYKDQTITDINLKNENINLGDLVLEVEATIGEEVVVTADRVLDNQAALLAMRKNAIQLSDAISAEEIKKTPDSDAGQALKRVSGITLVNDKFVYVRGVSERYSNTTLNGTSLATTEPDKKAFAFDMFPADFLENANVAKSFTPDLPGNFAGGLVQLNTIDFPIGFSLKISSGASMTDNLTFQNKFISTRGGSNDWLGFDDGTRAIPGNVPNSPSEFKLLTNNLRTQDENILIPAQQQWANVNNSFNSKQWIRDTSNGKPNGNFAISYTDIFSLAENYDLGIMASAMYGNSYNLTNIERGRLQADGTIFNYYGSGEQMVQSTNLGGLFNIAFKLGPNNSISLKNTYNNSSDDDVTIINGYKEQNQIKQFGYQYVQKSLFASQLGGEHNIPSLMNSLINWKIGYSFSKRDEPDFRRVRYSRNDENEPFRVDIYDMNGNGYQAGRFFSYLNENAYNASLDYTLPIENMKIKLGGLYESKDRDFLVRSFTIVKSNFVLPYYYNDDFGYVLRNDGNEEFYNEAFTSSPDQLFDSKNFAFDKLGYSEETKLTDSYKATEGLFAGYLMGDVPFMIARNKFRAILGLRIENSNQNLKNYYPIASNSGDSTFVDRNTLDFLPAINLNYEINNNMNLRLAASQTLTRPSLREYAPFTFYDFQFQGDVTGNPDLVRALIQNYDIRWEWFTAPGEVISVSGFYKTFTNAIEETIIPTSSNFKKTFTNAEGKALNYGIELELRKSLSFISESLDNFMFNMNIALINSEIEVKQVNKIDKRKMWGQSPYTINLGLYYANVDWGTTVNLSYNTFGKRIIQVADIQRYSFDDPHVYELPRNVIDLSISKVLFENIDLKFVAKDIFNEKSIWQQNGKTVSSNSWGRGFSLGIGYRFK